MSKSRSSEEKEKERDKEKEPEDDVDEDNAPQRPINQLQLTNEANSELKSPATSSNSPMVRNESAIPSSPPPSYEHVLEQTRVQKRQQMSWTEKNPEGDGAVADRRTPPKRPEILHKSSKEFYRAMAKQWGITCKMSDHCRCLDCQSHYFDCEYENNENQKTDGGLGAGTPMFISEVMQGSACVLL